MFMDREQYEDYLVDKAKELLNEELSNVEEEKIEKPEMRKKRNSMDEKAENDSTSKIPFSWDPREVEYLSRNRKEMSNSDLEKFLKNESEFQEEIEDVTDWKGFSRWEERFMVQNPSMDPGKVAEELGRDEKHVKLKMHMLGINVDRW